MALSQSTKEILVVAMANRAAANELSAAVDAAGNAQAADVAAVSQANAATQTASYVQADVQSIADLANANKVAINAALAALKAAGLMA